MVYHNYICASRMCCFPEGPFLLALMLAGEGQEAGVRREEEGTCHALLSQVFCLNQTRATGESFNLNVVKNYPYLVDLLIFISEMTLF